MRKANPEKPYRVFLTRHYISVEYFDVLAATPQRARALARKAAYKTKPDPRAGATDNGWITNKPVFLKDGLGSSAAGIAELREIIPGVFKQREA